MTSKLNDIPFARPSITDAERDAVSRVLSGHILTHGPETSSFEEAFCDYLGGEVYAVAVSSCTAALHLVYLELNIGEGDEVIVPAMTHVATAHAVEIMGAKPIFVDCELQTGNVVAKEIEKKITKNTKAISLVHFLGIPCDMEEINDLADAYSLPVVEDCALTLGGKHKGKHVGTTGYVGCFSFYPTKHITTGDGGMLVTRHKQVAETVSRIRAFGVDRSHSERSVPGVYDVPVLGLNYRMSEVQAAIGRQQINRLEQINTIRGRNFSRLSSLIGDYSDVLIIDAKSGDFVNSHYCLTIVMHGDLDDMRDDVMAALNSRGVGTSVYYPHPVPRLEYYRKKYGYMAAEFENAEAISDNSIALPVGPHLSDEDIDYIGRVFRDIIEGIR